MKIENKTVVGANADKGKVTLYFDNGETMTLPSNEQFTTDVINKITPALSRGESILLNMEDRQINIFSTMQEKTNGLVKFFRVAKKALLGIDTPTQEQVATISLPLNAYDLDNTEETIVAYVNDADTAVQEELEAAAEMYDDLVAKAEAHKQASAAPVIGVERLSTQIKHFSESENHIGFTNFMQRIAKVIGERSHSVDELLDFLQKADLPIDDNGDIVAYKRLRTEGDAFVDSHTGKVIQRVGSRVFMAHSLVDPDRRNQCSNGLHVGRRDYMGSFSGDAILIIKIAPEDVIAVPKDYSGSKMRCAGYNIVAKVTDNGFRLLCANKPVTDDPEMAALMAQILKGGHTPVTNLVEITGSYGSGLKFTELNRKGTKEAQPSTQIEGKEVEVVAALEEVKTLKVKVNPEVNSPKAIKEKVQKAAPKADKVEMTKEQKHAKKNWKKVLNGDMTKTALAKECNTSSRSLDRWAEKFNF